MNKQCNTGVRCDNIQSGVTTSGQVYQYQVASVMYQVYLSNIMYQVIACQASGVRYQVLGIKCQVLIYRRQETNRSCDMIQENNIVKYFKLFTTISIRIINYTINYPDKAS